MKEMILATIKTLPEQMEQLLDNYDAQIKELNKKITSLELENEQLRSVHQTLAKPTTDLEAITFWIEAVQHAVKENNALQMQALRKAIKEVSESFTNLPPVEQKMMLYNLFDLLASSEKKVGAFVLQLLIQLKDNVQKMVRHLLIEEAAFVLENIEFTVQMHPYVMELCRIYAVPTLLENYLDQLFEKPELLSALSEAQVSQLIWVCFIHDLEPLLLKNTPQFRAVLTKHELTLEDVTLENTTISEVILTRFINFLKATSLLTRAQRNVATFKLGTKQINSDSLDLKEKHLPRFPANALFVVKNTDLSKFQQSFHLIEEDVMAFKYAQTGSKTRSKKIVIRAFVTPEKDKAFIDEAYYRELSALHEPKLIRASMEYLDFVWPSTDVSINESKLNELQLKDKSELREIGYQVSTLSKETRWPILQQAVQQLGLAKVVHTIANNIRLKKAITNGPTIYAKAISEWESDLERLKMTYYQGNFRWPFKNNDT